MIYIIYVHVIGAHLKTIMLCFIFAIQKIFKYYEKYF